MTAPQSVSAGGRPGPVDVGSVRLLGLVLVLAGYRLWVIEATALPLDLEEAYYLHWAQQPALGYFSKPPMVAWLLAAATAVLGTGELAIKSVSVVLHTATALLVFALGYRLYSARVGAYAAVVFQALPIVGALSLFTTTDAPLHFFWALTLLGVVLARDDGRLRWWLLTGLAAGLGLLSKYTMGLLAIGLLLYVLITPAQRRLLRQPGLWLGVGLAAALLSLNLYWNWQHDFIAFRHTAHIAQLDRQLFHPDRLAEFLLPQIGVFGPVLFAALLGYLFRRWIWARDSHRLLLAASLPTLVLISLQAFLAEANINWASPAYVGLSLWVTAILLERARAWLLAGVAVNLLLTGFLNHYHALADLAGVELNRGRTPYFSRLGWRELGEQVRAWTRRYPRAALLGESRRLLAYLSYYGASPERDVVSWNPRGHVRHQFDLDGDLSQSPQRPMLYLSEGPLTESVLASFDQVQPLGEARYVVYPDLVRRVYGYYVQGFKGYP